MSMTVSLGYESTMDFFRLGLMARIKSTSGKASVGVKSGENHPLQWFASGSPGQTYPIEVTAPQDCGIQAHRDTGC